VNRTSFSTSFHSVALLGVLLACGGEPRKQSGADGGGNDTSAGREQNALRVALLTPGPISDRSWNGGAYEGLMRIRDSLGASVSHIQTKTPAEFEENFRQYGAQGYTIVFGHGFEFQDAATRVAPEFPKTIYITTSGNTKGPNLAGIRFAFEEPSYLAGMLAGLMTKSNAIAAIGGTELPPVKSSFEAFRAGAVATNDRVRFTSSYIGNWDDASAGKEATLAQIANGADIIFQNADAAGLGVFQAARESGKAYIIGSNADQNSVAPEVTLGSVVIDLPHAFLLVAREIHDGSFAPRVISLGSADDVVRFVINPALESKIPAAARSVVDSVRRAIVAGTAAVPAGAPAPVR
jgi:basic membrane protein A and related proteins